MSACHVEARGREAEQVVRAVRHITGEESVQPTSVLEPVECCGTMHNRGSCSCIPILAG